MKYAFALAAVAGLVAAQPHLGHQHLHKRQAAAMETVTDWTVVTVTDVVTVFGTPPAATSSPVAPAPAPAPSSKADAPPPAPPASSPAAAPSSAIAPPVQQPVQPSSAAAQPSPSAPAASSPAAEQPKPAAPSSAAPAPAQSSSAPPPSSGGGSGVGNYGTQPGASVPADCTKDAPCQEGMTTYTTGLGACGYDDTTNNDQVVALQENMFGSVTNTGLNSPSNPLCNKRIQITNPSSGATAVGVIRDRCAGCTGSGGIDLSPPLWAKLNDNQPGNRLPVEWYFLD